LLDNETVMHSCLASKPKSQAGTDKTKHTRRLENTGIRANKPERDEMLTQGVAEVAVKSASTIRRTALDKGVGSDFNRAPP
jgi:hypothetical protein